LPSQKKNPFLHARHSSTATPLTDVTLQRLQLASEAAKSGVKLTDSSKQVQNSPSNVSGLVTWLPLHVIESIHVPKNKSLSGLHDVQEVIKPRTLHVPNSPQSAGQVGAAVGDGDGDGVGTGVGAGVGFEVIGDSDGEGVGDGVGSEVEGDNVGEGVGNGVGSDVVGEGVGSGVGEPVGDLVKVGDEVVAQTVVKKSKQQSR